MKILSSKLLDGDLPEVRAEFDDRDWQTLQLTAAAAATPAGKSAVYRAVLPMTRDRLAAGVSLTFPVIDGSGSLYVNGQKAGTPNDWARPWTFDISQYLHEADNHIALLVNNDWGDGGALKGCIVDPVGRPLDNLQVSPTTTVSGDAISPERHRRFLASYTLEFQLPQTPAAMSVPWKLHLEADVNAFVTLNGHLLGRYWAVGPQREIWLPECWLNFGPDAKNVIKLQGRSTVDEPVWKVIKSAEARPYGP